MSLFSLANDAPPSGDTHDDANNKKSKAGKVNAVAMEKSEERSWMQHRTCELITKEFPDQNSFTGDDWTRCYAQARKEWNVREEEEKADP